MRWPIEDYTHRLPILVDGSATAAGTVEVTATLSARDAEFWRTVQADLDDIAVYAANGVTAYEYDYSSLSYANKTVVIEVNDVVHHVTNTATLLWLVYGNSTATDGRDPFVPAGALTGYTLNTGPAPGEPVFSLANPIAETEPTQTMRKRSTETVFAWFQVGPLGRLVERYNGRLFGEGPQSLSVSVPIALTATTAALRVWQDTKGALLCRVTISGGTDGNEYDAVLRVVTTEGRILEGVVRIEVND